MSDVMLRMENEKTDLFKQVYPLIIERDSESLG